MSVLFTTVYSGVALNTDITKGVVDRFRSLPIWRPGAARRRAARRQRALPRRRHGDHRARRDPRLPARRRRAGGVVAALALVVVFAFGLSWVFTTLGLLLRSPNAVMNAGFMAIFPLTFLSATSSSSPTTLPAALEAFVNVNPISHPRRRVARGLMDGNAEAGDIAHRASASRPR